VGELHVLNPAVSSEHLNVEFATDELNEKPASVDFVDDGGPEVMVVSGGAITAGGGVTGASIVQVYEAGVGSTFPSESIASTRKVCEPTASPEYVVGEVHAAKTAPSSEHLKSEFDFDELKEKLASVDPVDPGGPSVIVVSGGSLTGASIVQV